MIFGLGQHICEIKKVYGASNRKIKEMNGDIYWNELEIYTTDNFR